MNANTPQGKAGLISLVIPVYNEEAVLPLLLARLWAAAPAWGRSYELILVDDGSTDDSVALVRELSRGRPEVKLVRLSRNFGHQAAISAGLKLANGDAVILLDGDLQDPPEVLGQFLEKWEEGFEVVYAIREKRKESLVKRTLYGGFYRLLRAVSDLDIPLDSGDFCLMDRKVVEVLKLELPESIRFVRGLRTFVGFRQIGLKVERDRRAAGESKYGYRELMGLALDGIFGFSLLPLRIASYMGLVIALPSFLLGAFFIVHRIFNFKLFGYSPTDTPGLASLATGIFFLGGVVLIILGIIGEYLGRIYVEVKQRPTFLIREIEEMKSKSEQ